MRTGWASRNVVTMAIAVVVVAGIAGVVIGLAAWLGTDSKQHTLKTINASEAAFTWELPAELASLRGGASGDVDGDGNVDLVVGAPEFRREGEAEARGAIEVLFGGSGTANPYESGRTARIVGQTADQLGFAVAVGDVDGDGIDDIAATAPNAPIDGTTNVGRVVVVSGRRDFPKELSLDTEAPSMVIEGWTGQRTLGNAITVANLDRDADMEIAFSALGGGLAVDDLRGVIYVLGYRETQGSPIRLGQGGAGADAAVVGARPAELLGTSLAHGDVTADGIDDLIVGAALSDRAGAGDAGTVYVVAGGDLAPQLRLEQTNARMTILGPATSAQLGLSVDSGDVNGDGTADLLMGAPGLSSNVWGKAGGVYVIYGSPDLPATVQLAIDRAGAVVGGIDTDGSLGATVRAAGQLVVAAAPQAGAGPDHGEGMVALADVRGLERSQSLERIDGALGVRAPSGVARFGTGVIIADINGDDAPDMVVLAPQTGDGAPAAYGFMGPPDLLTEGP